MQPNKWVTDGRWAWLGCYWTVDPESGCWNWTGRRDRDGYGIGNLPGRTRDQAHRIAWRIAHAGVPVPAGMFVCHRCDNPGCVNEHHLFLGTALDNNRDAIAKGRRGPGELHGRAVLTTEDVQEIRRLVGMGASMAALARRYGVTRQNIYRIVTRRTWGHVA